MKTRVIIVLPTWHPRSAESKQAHPSTDPEQAEQRSKETGICPECFGPHYPNAIYCPWCRYKVQQLWS